MAGTPSRERRRIARREQKAVISAASEVQVAIPPVLHADVALRVLELANEILLLTRPRVLPDVDGAGPGPGGSRRAELCECGVSTVAPRRLVVQREYAGQIGLFPPRHGANDLVKIDVGVHVRSAAWGGAATTNESMSVSHALHRSFQGPILALSAPCSIKACH